MYSLEQQFAIICRSMAAVHRSVGEAEVQRFEEIANVYGLDVDAAILAWNDEERNPHDLKEVLKSVEEEEARDMICLGCIHMAIADNFLAADEIDELFSLVKIWNLRPCYLVIRIARFMRKYPDLEIEYTK